MKKRLWKDTASLLTKCELSRLRIDEMQVFDISIKGDFFWLYSMHNSCNQMFT